MAPMVLKKNNSLPPPLRGSFTVLEIYLHFNKEACGMQSVEEGLSMKAYYLA